MFRILSVVAVCALGLTACGTDVAETPDALESSTQGLACEYGTWECPGNTVCAFLRDDEGLCRPPCINGACANTSQVCCTQPSGQPYCNSHCF
ncbi:hypothetical protein [Myxococcus sp. Y35]|uniref:hypothetical protein n=1 Tax=Pseudomyxococcus flavus TaxID=3115648 RepID=UPI003CF8F5AC